MGEAYAVWRFATMDYDEPYAIQAWNSWLNHTPFTDCVSGLRQALDGDCSATVTVTDP